MNMKKYHKAMTALQRLHETLPQDGAHAWSCGYILKQFEEAASDFGPHDPEWLDLVDDPKSLPSDGDIEY